MPGTPELTGSKFLLRVFQPNGAESIVPLTEFPVRFGRAREADIILEDQNASRIHAELRMINGELFVKDCESINGTRLNGDLVVDASVHPGDTIAMGDCAVQLFSSDQPMTPNARPSDELIIRPDGTSGVLEIIRAIDLDQDPASGRGQDDLVSLNLALETDDVRDRLQKMSQAYHNLLMIMRVVSSVGDHAHIAQVCEQFITALKNVFPLAENVAVFEIADENLSDLKVIHRQGFDDRFEPQNHPSKTVLRRVVEEMRAVYAVDARRDPRFTKSDSIVTRGVRSLMCAPLIARGEVNGAIYVENLTQPYCFGPFDLNFLSIFAFHLGGALETARLLSQRDRAFERAVESIKSVRQDKTALLLQYSQSEKRFRALFQQSALGAAVINVVTGKIEEVNDGLVRMMGFNRRQFTLINYTQLFVPADARHTSHWLETVRKQGEGSFKARLLTSTGEELVAQQSCRALRVGENMVMVAYFIDITAKERAELETQRQLRRVTALSELSQGLMSTMETQSIFSLLMEKFSVVLPLDRFHIAMIDPSTDRCTVVHSARKDHAGNYVNRALDTRPHPLNSLSRKVFISREPMIFQQTRDASLIIEPHERGGPFDHPGPSCLGTALYLPLAARNQVIGIIAAESSRHDAYDTSHIETSRALAAQAALAISNAGAFEAIKEQQDNLRGLSLQLLTAQESERARISRELHDGVGQQLTAMKYILGTIGNAAKNSEQEKLTSSIGEARELAMQIIEDLRAISLDLRPTMLDDLGLQPTLEWLARQHERRYGTTVEIHCELPAPELPPQIASAAYRIIQEALGNVAKHASAKKISIHVLDTGETLRMTVVDDGVGFDSSRLSNKQALQGCSGILNMKERSHLLAGDFRVETAVGQGTKLFITIPTKDIRG
ncbi:GAF domain-containing protein [Candidatus Sumerlaeota bacterium]|nr:GAF domain-containing protein [Candidatus Sumerlaeota bacterium]